MEGHRRPSEMRIASDPVYGRPLWVPSSHFAKRRGKIFIWADARHKQRRIIHQGGHKARAGTRHRPYAQPDGHRIPSKMHIASDPCTGAPCGCPLRISQNGGEKYSFGRTQGINGGALFTRAGTRHGRAQGTAPTRTPDAHRVHSEMCIASDLVYGRPLWVPSSNFAKRRKKYSFGRTQGINGGAIFIKTGFSNFAWL